jgi:hypothetical protein
MSASLQNAVRAARLNQEAGTSGAWLIDETEVTLSDAPNTTISLLAKVVSGENAEVDLYEYPWGTVLPVSAEGVQVFFNDVAQEVTGVDVNGAAVYVKTSWDHETAGAGLLQVFIPEGFTQENGFPACVGARIEIELPLP